jgi:hypothetical protein
MELEKWLRKIRRTQSGEYLAARFGFGYKLLKRVPDRPKIGFAILAWERPEYLQLCLETLFQTNLHDYDITFLLQDDGSSDPRVAELINQERDPKYKIVRSLTPRGAGNAGAAINKAMRKLMEIDNFDIIGWGDPDALFHPEWLDVSIDMMTWAKKNHRDHVLGPFSTFNSSDYKFHQILGTYPSPFGNYVVKRQMGMLNYLYFKEDFLQLGFFPEVKEDETLMTAKFDELRVRNFCSEISYLEHIGRQSSLVALGHRPADQSVNEVHGIKLKQDGWKIDIQKHLDLPSEVYHYQDWEYMRSAFNGSLGVERRLVVIFWRYLKKAFKLLMRSADKFFDYYRYVQFWNRAIRMSATLAKAKFRLSLRVLRSSPEAIEVAIPAIAKDLEVLPHTVASLRKNLRHPIVAIKIISPNDQQIIDFCAANNCQFVDETTVLPITFRDIDYKPQGKDRSKWILQQLLKLGISTQVSTENYLIWDADTLLLRPQAFVKNGVFEFDVSDESHTPYYWAHVRLLGRTPPGPMSFVSHHALANVKIMTEMFKEIEAKHGAPWWKAYIAAADHSDYSGIADYETYGNYVFEKYPKQMVISYWHNYSARRDKLPKLVKGWRRWFLSRRYKTLSFQHYNA